MKVLLVFAHPEPASFCGALRDVATGTLTGLGHEVVVSDLYRQGFDPAGGARDFLHGSSTPFVYQEEQRHAAREGTFAPDIAAEASRLLACDLLMLNFPFWWYGPPAILKGWIDRVLAAGFAYDRGRAYETGALAGRAGLLTVTTGSPPERYSTGGAAPFATMEQLLLPLQEGLFRYVGMKAVEPFVAYSAARVDDARRQRYLAEYRAHLERHVGKA